LLAPDRRRKKRGKETAKNPKKTFYIALRQAASSYKKRDR
jgi:hypothetical protein